jgi:CheY-like chemotaxis protein
VVDDDPLFDGLLVDHLTEDGEYHVLSARNGEQALRVLEQHDVDVLITDIKMPHKDGFELVNEMRTEHPTISVIVVSGFGRPRWVDAESAGGIQFLEKPVNFARLKKALRKAVYDAVPVPRDPLMPGDCTDARMLDGQAAQFPVLDMIQICCIAERTGCFTLHHAGMSGQAYLERGEIVHAEVGALSGPAAFYEIAAWDHANFRFDTEVRPPRRTIFKAWENLVYEGIQRRSANAAA